MRVDVSRRIEQSSLGPLHALIVAVGFSIMLIDGYDLVSMAMILPIISEDWGIEPSGFSVALSAVLMGVLVGSTAAGYLGDRIGRRWTICLMLSIASAGMLSTPYVEGMQQLTVARFVTGIGAGGSIPVTLAYTQEFMPLKVRNLLTTMMYTGAGMGSVLGGAIGPTIVEAGGWQLVFLVGGMIPVVTVVVVAAALPESLRFLVSRGCDAEVAGRLLSRLNPAYSHEPENTYFVEETAQRRGVVRELFGGGMTKITLLVWTVFFANQFLVFYTGTFMPTLLVGAGVEFATALYIQALFNLGGVLGGIAFGLGGDRIEPARILMVSYGFAAVFLATFAYSASSSPMLMAVGVFTGASVVGSSFLLGVMTTALYPTRARSTGIGAALAIGRFGAISSPLVGGVLLDMGYRHTEMMLVATGPALLSAWIVFLLWRALGGAEQNAVERSS